ncbi:oligosaccharide flippase family protein [Microbulbifer salipaludis]|uniref:Oligosaccharide flippase family protein n=1 Tax=Microbulbifer salipaludis TaxID=187980 RepID=A0ABS3E363_9GAMM|nr:oligosaccharide flippase family protein [Microbulbifer salipaludis]MBN8429744.1 oligosaccharide flippase family protein [Microbulbifer salipaludis]
MLIANRGSALLQSLRHSNSTKFRGIRSAGWTLIGYGSGQLIRLLSNLILTRLLAPDMFGLMALAQVFITGMVMFSDIGIKTSIVRQKSTGNDDFLNTAWTVQIIRGAFIFLICLLLAYPISLVYEEPTLFPVLAALGISALIQGFQTTAFATAEKNLSIGKQTVIQIATQIFATLVMVVWSYFYPTIWALVAGSILSTLLSVILNHIYLDAEHRHTFRVSGPHLTEIIRFGKWIFISSVIGFFANQMDKLFLGKVLTMTELGVYVIAFTLAQLPESISNSISSKVMMPIYSKVQDADIKTIRSHAFKMRLNLGSFCLFITLFFVIFGQEIITFLYDDRYVNAGWMLEALALGVAIRVATKVGPFLLSRGDSKTFTGIVAVKTGVVFTSMLIGWVYFGVPGVIYATVAASIANYCLEIRIYRRHNLWLWKLDASFFAVIALSFGLSRLI